MTTRQPSRALVGHCPACGRVCIVENDYESWPLVTCKCGETMGTTALANARVLERDFVVRVVTS